MLTAPYVVVEFVGLEHDWTPVRGTVELTPEGAAKLGRFLSELADTAESDHAAHVDAAFRAAPMLGPERSERRRSGVGPVNGV